MSNELPAYSKTRQLKKSRANLKQQVCDTEVITRQMDTSAWVRIFGPYTFKKADRIARELESLNRSGRPQYSTRAI